MAQVTQTATNLCPDNYSVIVVDNLGDTIAGTVAIGNGVGIGDYESVSVLIYPNPNNGQFSVQYSKINLGQDMLLIYNAIGQVIFKEIPKQAKIEIDLNEFGAGVYNLELISGDQIIIRKIIVY